ncbi:MAG: RNA polymerase II mediator complex subunit [Alyxoria varia]|nr:MAG: RNA polymerase II mediator complex subunit [Alyxoria varia]
MATTRQTVDDQMKDIIHNLYCLMVQSHDYRGAQTTSAMKSEINYLLTNLQDISRTAPSLQLYLPPEIVDYVDSGRNPDIYTREFVEVVQKNNQLLKGKSDAFAGFRDVLAQEIAGGVPELSDAVGGIVSKTGGVWEEGGKTSDASATAENGDQTSEAKT